MEALITMLNFLIFLNLITIPLIKKEAFLLDLYLEHFIIKYGYTNQSHFQLRKATAV